MHCVPLRSAATGSLFPTIADVSSTSLRPRSTYCRRSRPRLAKRMTVMLDSGVGRGGDILIAPCLGAQFVFFGVLWGYRFSDVFTQTKDGRAGLNRRP